MSLITIDFESFYDSDFGFSKLTTEEYVRDRRFEVIGFSIKVDRAPAVWYTGDHAYLLGVLQGYNLEQHAVCMHNAMFDAAILHWIYGIKPKLIMDTMAMGRGLVGLDTSCSLKKLGEYFKLDRAKGTEVEDFKGYRRGMFTSEQLARYGAYCCNDTEMTFDLLQILLPHMVQGEMELIDWTVRCFTEPKLVLDADLIDVEYRAFMARRDGLLLKCGISDVSVLRSDDTMADFLLALGIEPPTKYSVAQEKMVWAFAKSDTEFMDLREHSDERVVALVEARLGSKTSQVQTRLERFRGIASRGPLPVPLVYAGATPTRRWAGTDNINLQNLPRGTKENPSALRRAIKAPPGKKMAAPDLSQIELRVNAWQSGQTDVLHLLRSGGDSYADMATAVFGYPVTKKTHELERFIGKSAVLGCGYGCAGLKFQTMLKIGARREGKTLQDESLPFAQNVVDIYRAKNSQIKNFWYTADRALETIALGGRCMIGPYEVRDHKVWLPNGSYLYFPNLSYREKTGKNEQGCEWMYERIRFRSRVATKIYGAKLVENITQAVARLFITDALLRLQTVKYADGRPVFDIVMSVHDELGVLCEQGLDDKWIMEVMKWALTTPPAWAPDIPLDFECNIGQCYADCK
jgi:DNA polymerase